MTCDRCEGLRIDWPIRSPRELSETLRVAADHVADGTLAELHGPGPAVRLQDLPVEGPWPDHVEHTFACTRCGGRFRLTAETYHGAGGRWSPLTTD